MKIVVRNSDGLVLYQALDNQNVDLNTFPALVGNIRVGDTSVNAATCHAVEGVTLPSDFIAGWYTFSGGTFTLTAEGQAAKTSAARALLQPELDASAKSSFIAGLKGKANSLIRQGKTAEAMKLLIKAQDLTHG